ncbi:MAG TPA: hypothetical protein VH062_12720 [Polyangiaceae bacterium]|nr:hypothetical protein [Polyangiaceae bacterium]
MKRRLTELAGGLVLLLALGGVGHADPAESDEYRDAIARAVAAFDASDLAAARGAFEQAHALSPSARTFRGIAVVAFRQGDFLTAVTAFRAALADARKPLTPEQHAEATDLLTKADRHVGHVLLVPVPASATVRFDGRVEDSRDELDVASGTHVFRADAPGHETVERETFVAAGIRTTVKLVLPVTAATPAATEPAPTDVTPAAAEPSKGRLWTWVALGAAPVFGGVGLGIWLSGLSDAKSIRDCTQCSQAEVQRRRDDAGLGWKETWATVAGVAAGAALGGAVVLYFVEGSGTEKHTPVAVGVSGTTAWVKGSF